MRILMEIGNKSWGKLFFSLVAYGPIGNDWIYKTWIAH